MALCVTFAAQRFKAQVVNGSANDIDVVARAVAGVDTVIVALSAIDDQGVTLGVRIATLLDAASLHVYEGTRSSRRP